MSNEVLKQHGVNTTVKQLPFADFCTHLSNNQLSLQIGPFLFRMQTKIASFAALLYRMYADYPAIVNNPFANFHIELYRPKNYRRWWRPQVFFAANEERPFAPFPLDTALPHLEWGLNWCVANHAHQYLMLHAGVVEKYGQAIIFPGEPGFGKSTLSAALSYRGWRLLSDEFALVQPEDSKIAPFPRLMPLKNEAIDVIRQFAPDALIGPKFPKTRKGTIAHVRPDLASIARAQETAQPCYIICPQYKAGAEFSLEPLIKDQAFFMLSSNSFNYELIGMSGFKTACNLIDNCECYLLQYSDLGQAVTELDRLLAATADKPAVA